MHLTLLTIIASLSCAFGAEVVKVALQGEHPYHRLQEANPPVVVCEYMLAADEGSSEVVINKNGVLLHKQMSPSHPNPGKSFTVSKSLNVGLGRAAEGLITCTVTPPQGDAAQGQLEFHVADSPDGNQIGGAEPLQSNCQYTVTQILPKSNPPIQAKCGIWLFDHVDNTKDAGEWMEDSFGVKMTYSTEEDEWEEKKDQKNPKLIVHMLNNVEFKLKEIPPSRRFEYRCKTYYKFGSDSKAVRYDLGTFQKPGAMEPYVSRCPSLDYLKDLADEGEGEGELTISYSPRRRMEDCQGMMTTSSKFPLKAALTCTQEDGNSTKLTVKCQENYEWKSETDEDPRAFAEHCGNGSPGLTPLGALTLLMATALHLFSSRA